MMISADIFKWGAEKMCWLTVAQWQSGWSRWRERRARRRPRKPRTGSPPVWSTAEETASAEQFITLCTFTQHSYAADLWLCNKTHCWQGCTGKQSSHSFGRRSVVALSGIKSCLRTHKMNCSGTEGCHRKDLANSESSQKVPFLCSFFAPYTFTMKARKLQILKNNSFPKTRTQQAKFQPFVSACPSLSETVYFLFPLGAISSPFKAQLLSSSLTLRFDWLPQGTEKGRAGGELFAQGRLLVTAN